jgi:hypothetical protein
MPVKFMTLITSCCSQTDQVTEELTEIQAAEDLVSDNTPEQEALIAKLRESLEPLANVNPKADGMSPLGSILFISHTMFDTLSKCIALRNCSAEYYYYYEVRMGPDFKVVSYSLLLCCQKYIELILSFHLLIALRQVIADYCDMHCLRRFLRGLNCSKPRV